MPSRDGGDEADASEYTPLTQQEEGAGTDGGSGGASVDDAAGSACAEVKALGALAWPMGISYMLGNVGMQACVRPPWPYPPTTTPSPPAPPGTQHSNGAEGGLWV